MSGSRCIVEGRWNAIRAAFLGSLVLACGGQSRPQSLESNFDGVRRATPLVESTLESDQISVWLEPSQLEVAQVGSFTLAVDFLRPLVPQDTILIDFPKAWFPHPWPRHKPLQTERPDEPHYLEASIDGMPVSISWDHFSVDGERERYRHLIRLQPDRAVEAPSRLRLRWSGTTAPYIAGSDSVRVWLSRGEDRWETSRAGYTVQPGPARWLRLYAPSVAVVGEEVEFEVSALDRFYNHATEFTMDGLVTVHGENLEVAVVAGSGSVAWRPQRSGIYWPALRVQSADVDVEIGGGNPVRVFAAGNPPRVYWGDLHSHSRISMDAIGMGDFEYARDVARLDFYASTEHADDDWYPTGFHRDGITPAEWLELRERVRSLYRPDEFVTLLGYECSLKGGHYNVYFSGLDGVPSPAHDVKNVEALLERLRTGAAFAIPHHTGKRPTLTEEHVRGPGLQPLGKVIRPSSRNLLAGWDVLRGSGDKVPAIEIYSAHGSSEHYHPHDRLSYESVRYTGAMSQPGPYYARDAWSAGHKLGVVAGSDNHVARPGMPHLGLTAVYADELTRPAIFESLRTKRTYATTGERILLDLVIDGVAMGGHLSVHGQVAATVAGDLLIAAPRSIAYAEVVAHRPDEGWVSVKRWEDSTPLLEAEFRLSIEPGMVIYARAQLVGKTDDRVARAWSSPVWVVQ